MATKQSQVRLTDADKAKIEAIRERFGLPSASSAIRYAIETFYRDLLRDEAAERAHAYNRSLGLD